MKKIAICAAIGAIFTCEGMNEKALVLRNSSSNAVARSEILESEIRRQERESKGLITREDLLINSINYREISSPTVDGDQVTVKVQDFVEDELVGESYSRSYPLQKSFLEYTHDFEKGVSHPVEELFAIVNDLEYSDIRGKIVVNPEFINEGESLIHQLRIDKNSGTNGYQMNDAELKAIPFMETFIETEDWEEVIGEAKLREDKAVSYEKVNGSLRTNNIGPRFSKPGDNSFDYQRQEVLEDWRRPDGSIFTKKRVKDIPIARPKPCEDKIVVYGGVYGPAIVYRFFKDRDNDFESPREEVFEDWRQPNGSIFTSRTEKKERFAKPKLPAPVPAPASRFSFRFRGIFRNWLKCCLR